MDAATPKLVPIYNRTEQPIIIRKGTKVARISLVPEGETTQTITKEDLDAIAYSDTVNFLNVTKDFLSAKGNFAMSAEGEDGAAKPPTPPKEVLVYGMTKPDQYPVIKDCHGVEICANNPEFAEKLKILLERYHLYHNRGLIPIPNEDKMRIKLLKG
ncbi:hypothetical protein LY76DRAFT_334214 [Colletotrichum caudatum]|nr:hypothetical protein LY76DRAFT_334214 [Colletotrichum caudatum]